MVRLSGSDPDGFLASSESSPGSRAELALGRATRLRSPSAWRSSRALRRISFGGVAFAALLGGVLAQEPSRWGSFNPLDWYPPSEATGSALPTWPSLPEFALPPHLPDPLLQAAPLGPPQPLRPAHAVDIAELTFHPTRLGPPQGLERTPGPPVADLTPAPLGPAQPLERAVDPAERALSAWAFVAAPLGPPQALEIAGHPAAILTPAPLGPPQRIETARHPAPAPAQAVQAAHASDGPAATGQILPVANLSPHLLGPPQPLQAPADRTALEDGPGFAPAPSATGSVRRPQNVMRKGGTVVVRARN